MVIPQEILKHLHFLSKLPVANELITMYYSKAAVSPLLTHCRYCILVLNLRSDYSYFHDIFIHVTIIPWYFLRVSPLQAAVGESLSIALRAHPTSWGLTFQVRDCTIHDLAHLHIWHVQLFCWQSRWDEAYYWIVFSNARIRAASYSEGPARGTAQQDTITMTAIRDHRGPMRTLGPSGQDHVRVWLTILSTLV